MNPLDLLAGLVLEDGRVWGTAATSWQWDTARVLFDASAPPFRWDSRPRGGSKTTDAAGISLVKLMVLPSGSRCYVFASDADQARLLIDAMAGFVMRTPELSGHVEVGNYQVKALAGNVLEVLSADAASSWGIRPAFVIADEVCQWPGSTNARGLWESVYSSLGKVTDARLLAISTSGDPGHWTRKIYDVAKKSPLWTVQDVPGPVPWVSTAYLDGQRHMLPESIYRRMHLNEWAAPEDRLSTVDDIRACVTLSGPQEPVQGQRYVVGVDIGLKHDRTVAAVCHVERDGGGVHTVLDRMQVWQGRRFHPVDLSAVEEWLREVARHYNRAKLVVDPYQAIGMAQRLRGTGISVEEFAFSSQSVGRLALALHTAMREHRLALPDDEELIDELANVRLRETAPGVYRLDHDRDKHDDRAIALALAVLHLTENSAGQGAAFKEHWRREAAKGHADRARDREPSRVAGFVTRGEERKAARQFSHLISRSPRFNRTGELARGLTRCEHRWRQGVAGRYCVLCHITEQAQQENSNG